MIFRQVLDQRTCITTSIPQVGIPQVGIPQVGIPQVGIPQVGIPQVGRSWDAGAGISVSAAKC